MMRLRRGKLAAMAGVPLLNGFLSKEMFFAETLYIDAMPAVEVGLPVIATLAGVFAVVYSLRVGYGVFFGAPPTDLPREPHEPARLPCRVASTLVAPIWSTATRW